MTLIRSFNIYGSFVFAFEGKPNLFRVVETHKKIKIFSQKTRVPEQLGS